MTKYMLLLGALLAIALPALVRADTASYPLRDARQVTAAQTASVTNAFADDAGTIDRIEVRVTAPAFGTFTLRHVWTANAIANTNSWTVAYTNTATAELKITNAWPLLTGDLISGDFGQTVTGKFWLGRSKTFYSPAR